jgi:hypothetical protein
MKSAEAFVEALEQGLSPVEALHSLPNHELLYLDRVPAEIYRAALRNGWRFCPVSSGEHLTAKDASTLRSNGQLTAVEGIGRGGGQTGAMVPGLNLGFSLPKSMVSKAWPHSSESAKTIGAG